MHHSARILFLLVSLKWCMVGAADPAAAANASVASPDSTRTKVTVSVFYETLCPDSKRFVVNQLVPTYAQLKDHLNVVLVPFGKASVRNDQATCQHGVRECQGNRLQACVIEQNQDNTSLALDYVNCMFTQAKWTDTLASGNTCAEKLNLDWPRIKGCFDEEQGQKLIHHNWNLTTHLVPKMTYVPWIVINGGHSKSLQNGAEYGLRDYLCEHYLNNVNTTATAPASPSQCDK